MKPRSLILLALGFFAAAFNILAADRYVPFEGEKTTWHRDFDRYDYVMDEVTFEIRPFKRPENEANAVGVPAKGQRRCIVVVPKQPAPGNPWSWQGCYWDHEPQGELELLRRGFHIAFITPDPGKQWDAWYEYLTTKHGLSPKPSFVGMSKGGVNEYDWATANPDKVSCIYADNPAINTDAFGKLGDLAKNDVALLNICGSMDFLLQRHTLKIENSYQQLGGQITVLIKDGQPHHPHSLRDPRIIADWIVEHYHADKPPLRPDFADDKFTKSYYYSLESTNIYFEKEKTFVNCRGPGFVPSYERFDAKTPSQWGLIGLSIITPKKPAIGLPWVFRADAIDRDARVDQALLARGFHIVIPPLTAQSGAVKTQWDNAYKLLTEHGFAKKAVMEGAATGAGEAYAWAIENPDKVSCIFGHNAALRALMTKTVPMENLGPLAKANIPLIHLSDKNDPWFDQYTKPLQSRYADLGGSITVIHNQSADSLAADEAKIVDLIESRAVPIH